LDVFTDGFLKNSNECLVRGANAALHQQEEVVRGRSLNLAQKFLNNRKKHNSYKKPGRRLCSAETPCAAQAAPAPRAARSTMNQQQHLLGGACSPAHGRRTQRDPGHGFARSRRPGTPASIPEELLLLPHATASAECTFQVVSQSPLTGKKWNLVPHAATRLLPAASSRSSHPLRLSAPAAASKGKPTKTNHRCRRWDLHTANSLL